MFDEPTSSLSQVEADRLYELIDRLKARGVTCIYVSHRMPEVFRLCDTVTVLRDGRHVATRPAAELAESELVQLMIGRPLAEYFPRTADDAVRATSCCASKGSSSPGKFEDVSFSLRAGEVVGLAGLVGAGRSEVAAALFGLDARAARRSLCLGHARADRQPARRDRLGIGLVPEDRKRQGLVLARAAVHNTSLPILERLSRLSWVRRGGANGRWREVLHRLRVRTPRDRHAGRAALGRESAEGRAGAVARARARGFSFSTSRRAAWTSAPRRRSTR